MSFLSLFALACHFAGDFPLQTDRMAAEKFDNWMVRSVHCAVYTACFTPFTIVSEFSFYHGSLFLALLGVSHYAIDSRRWAEDFPEFPTRALWFDQAYHIIALALIVALVGLL